MENVEYKKLFFIYLLAHGGILFILNSVYWDDWILFHQKTSFIIERFSQAGAFLNWIAYIHVVFLKMGLWFYRIFIFFLFYLMGLNIYNIIKRWYPNSNAEFTVAVLFLTVPNFQTRIAIINFGSVICLYSFFWAWRILQERKYLPAALLFFFSFNVNSLILFYSIPLLIFLYNDYCENKFKFIIYNAILLILPIIYLVLKIVFFKPYGLYSGYNENLAFSNIVPMIEMQIHELWIFALNYGFIFLIPFVYYILKSKNFINKSFQFIWIGFISYILGAFPYWLSGHPPIYYEWASRHQLLLAFGLSVLLAGLISILKRTIQPYVLVVVVSIFCSYDLNSYYKFYIDWGKQKQIIALLKDEYANVSGSTFVFNDTTLNLNAVGRRYRFYEWSGIVEYAVGSLTNFGINDSELDELISGKYDLYIHNHYKSDDYVYDKDKIINITIYYDCSNTNFFYYFSPKITFHKPNKCSAQD